MSIWFELVFWDLLFLLCWLFLQHLFLPSFFFLFLLRLIMFTLSFVLMMGHNVCFKGVIWEIIPKLFVQPPSYLKHCAIFIFASLCNGSQLFNERIFLSRKFSRPKSNFLVKKILSFKSSERIYPLGKQTELSHFVKLGYNMEVYTYTLISPLLLR